MNGSRNQSNNKELDKNIDFHFLDLTVTFYAFDFKSYDCSPDEVNGGYGVVFLLLDAFYTNECDTFSGTMEHSGNQILM